METLQDAYLDGVNEIIDYGLKVVPVRHGTREPMVRHWTFGRRGEDGGRKGSTAFGVSRRDELFDRFLSIEPRPHIAIPHGQPGWRPVPSIESPDGSANFRSYTLAVDVDAEAGGLDSWSELLERLGEPPVSATVTTKTEGCFHWIVWSDSEWSDPAPPAVLVPGLEIKRAGHLSIAPPTRGYAWQQSIGAVGLAHWPALDAYLAAVSEPRQQAPRREPAQAPASGILTPEQLGGDVDSWLAEIAGAPRGERTRTLLVNGGRVAYATAVGRGLSGPDEVRKALWRAAERAGLVDDYEARELLRKVEVYAGWAEPTGNPLLNGGAVPRGPAGAHKLYGGESHFAGRGGEVERAVFTYLAGYARHEFRPAAAGYLAKALDLPRRTVSDALDRLKAKGLVEQGPGAWNEGRKATSIYRLSGKGRSLLTFS